MSRNMKQWVAEQIAAPRKKSLPVLSFPSIQMMGITVRDLISSSDKQAEGMKLIADRVDTAASVSLMDLSLEAEAFGSTIRVSDDEVPTVIGALVTSEEEAEALEIPEIGTGRTGIYIEAIEKAVKLITDRPVLAGTIGPFSLAGRLIGVSEALVLCYEEPDMVHAVMEKSTQFLVKYINAYKAVGADGVLMAEPLTGLLSPALEEEFSTPYVKRIVEATQTDEFGIFYHNCGNNVVQMADSLATLGVMGYHFGNVINVADILPEMPGNTIVMGNVDPARQLRNGTPESVRQATLDVMEACCGYPNFVISSGCDIPPMSPWENIEAFLNAVEEFSQK